MATTFAYKDTPTVKGQIGLTIPLSDIPSVQRLATAVSNIVELQTDGTYCTCQKKIDNPMIKNHTPVCIELSEAYKAIKENI
jgi:hypothetical protein